MGTDKNPCLKFDESNQNKVFEEYIIKVKRKAVIEYLEANGSVENAAYALTKEFASIGVEKDNAISSLDVKERVAEGGKSYYAGMEQIKPM